MFYKDRIKNLTTFYPELTRVWIKTEDPRTPLKSVWINDSAFRKVADDHHCALCDAESTELAEDHLLLASWIEQGKAGNALPPAFFLLTA